MTSYDPDILCIGSVLWDVIGRTPIAMQPGADVPGHITQVPGGVALNVAMTLARFDMTPALLSSVGMDPQGLALVDECNRLGLNTEYLYRSDDLPTDKYMAIEGAGGLMAAIADAHSLENAGAKILRPLTEGPLGSAKTPYPGLVALDGNLTVSLLEEIATSDAFSGADLRIAPASPGKAERLLPFVRSGRGTLYVNLEEAGLLCHTIFDSAEPAARRLVERGAHRVVVTNGAQPCCDATTDGIETACPPEVLVTRITGAGDTFMAAHIAAERAGKSRANALEAALSAAAMYVSGDIPT